jgi:hypothetical protein
VAEGDRETAELLLRHGAAKTINTFGAPGGLTALGIAASRLDIPMIELLLKAGADPDVLDEDFSTARQRLPPRERSDPQAWDTAMDLLELRKQ